MTSLDLLILRAMRDHKWTRPFATEYVMARNIHGLGHERAVRHAQASPYVKQKDKPT